MTKQIIKRTGRDKYEVKYKKESILLNGAEKIQLEKELGALGV